MLTYVGFLNLGLPTGLIVLVGLAVLVFEIVMFIDAVRNKKLGRNEQLLWVIGMLLIHPFVAIAYYFLAYSKKR